MQKDNSFLTGKKKKTAKDNKALAGEENGLNRSEDHQPMFWGPKTHYIQSVGLAVPGATQNFVKSRRVSLLSTLS